jgi:predicted acetyltransferase
MRQALTTMPNLLHGYTEGMSFSAYLELLAARERGENLPPDHVASTFLFAFVDSAIVGRAAVRHSLNDFLALEGGHIGFAVLPEFRRRGHATAILRLSMEFARETLGIQRILVTCDEGNIGSMRAIERNGGILEDIVPSSRQETLIRRYWL